MQRYFRLNRACCRVRQFIGACCRVRQFIASIAACLVFVAFQCHAARVCLTCMTVTYLYLSVCLCDCLSQTDSTTTSALRYRDDSMSQDVASDDDDDDDNSYDERECTLTSMSGMDSRDENQNVNKDAISLHGGDSQAVAQNNAHASLNSHVKGTASGDQSEERLQLHQNKSADDNSYSKEVLLNQVFHSSPNSNKRQTSQRPVSHVVLDNDMETVLETKQLRPHFDDESIDGSSHSRSYNVQSSSDSNSELQPPQQQQQQQQQPMRVDDDKNVNKKADVTSAAKQTTTPTTPKTPPGMPEELKKVACAYQHTCIMTDLSDPKYFALVSDIVCIITFPKTFCI